ncbi:MAG: SDR family NAD(P)-dependent oxidoreductase, partial [Bacteroidia bacterium]|nr:SDR family NAD(P)-dependent oxidoreductase [Bacteroidia bacterium]
IKQQGSVVGISSIAGYVGLPARSGYSASKFAMQGFLDVLRVEMLKKNVHVLVACPGFTASNIRAVALNEAGLPQGDSPRDEGRMMTAEETARHICRAIEKRKRKLILSGEGRLAVWMNKWFPSIVDRSVYRKMVKEPDSPLARQ